MFVGSPALSQAGSVLPPVKCTLGSHGTQSRNGREEGSGCFEDSFKELVLLEEPAREETSKLKSRGEWCWLGPAVGAGCPQSRAEAHECLVPEACWCHSAPRLGCAFPVLGGGGRAEGGEGDKRAHS